MTTIQQKSSEELLADLGLSNLSQQEKDKAVAIVSQRFQEIIITAVIENLADEQKKDFIAALQDPQTVEQKITELTAQIPGLDIAIQDALVHEFEALKFSMHS